MVWRQIQLSQDESAVSLLVPRHICSKRLQNQLLSYMALVTILCAAIRRDEIRHQRPLGSGEITSNTPFLANTLPTSSPDSLKLSPSLNISCSLCFPCPPSGNQPSPTHRLHPHLSSLHRPQKPSPLSTSSPLQSAMPPRSRAPKSSAKPSHIPRPLPHKGQEATVKPETIETGFRNKSKSWYSNDLRQRHAMAELLRVRVEAGVGAMGSGTPLSPTT